MELTSAMDKANMNLKGAGEQNMAFAGKIQMLEVDITKIRQVRKVPFLQLRDPKKDFIFNFNFDDKVKSL